MQGNLNFFHEWWRFFNGKYFKAIIKKVPDAYPDFFNGMIAFLEDEEEITEKIIKYINNNPNATTSEILEYHTSIDPTELEIVDDDENEKEK